MSPALQRAIDRGDMELFLGDRLFHQLPDAVSKAVNATLCNFLLVAWRKRQPMWAKFHEEGREWRLKPD